MSSRSPDLTRRACLTWAAGALLAPVMVRAACPCDDPSLQKDAPTTRPSAGMPDALRVCADPDNLPFSNHNFEGFEDRIASLVAQDLGLKLDYRWIPQRLGFFREALKTGDSNLVMAAPAGYERAALSDPYYRSSYCFVYRKDATPIRSFDDEALKSAKIGVPLSGGYNTPPTHALIKRKLIDKVTGFPVFDESSGRPGEKIVAAVANKEIDVAIAWGPSAGYFAQRQTTPLEVVPVSPLEDQVGDVSMAFAFDICMALRRPDKALKQKVNEVIARRRADIDQILDSFAVPRLPLQAHKATRGKDDGHDKK
jgi:mxaJ protein